VRKGEHVSLREPGQIRDLKRRFRKSKWGALFRRRHRLKILGLNMAFIRFLFEEINGFDENCIGWDLGKDNDLRDRAPTYVTSIPSMTSTICGIRFPP
jgi:hypothetical protein